MNEQLNLAAESVPSQKEHALHPAIFTAWRLPSDMKLKRLRHCDAATVSAKRRTAEVIQLCRFITSAARQTEHGARKLNGKPGDFTPPDYEFDPRRVHHLRRYAATPCGRKQEVSYPCGFALP